MPKPYTSPILYNEALQIDISNLKSWGYLDPKQTNYATLHWSSNGNPVGSISIQVNTHNKQPYIELDYKYGGEPRNYKVKLVSIPSNLCKGLIWYFLCPQTNKRCRKLYSIGGYFLHRTAFNGCMYESQTASKRIRLISRVFGAEFKIEELYKELYKKHSKKTYAGKPTKRYLRIMKQLKRAENVPYSELDWLFI